MLLELVVENYAVVERLRVRFHSGLNVLTGETGSGKSIVVDAVALLLGGRASAEMIRSGAASCRVSGIFEKPASSRFAALATEAGLELAEDELLVEREIQANGKSRAFVDSRPVTATLLKELAPFLGDIHGQHDQQRLFSREAQRDLLDEFAAAPAALDAAARAYHEWRGLARELEELDRAEQERLRLADLWSFQKREIEQAALQDGEDADLESERRRLANVNRLAEAVTAACEALYDGEGAAVRPLGTAVKKLEEISRIDQSLAEVHAALRSAVISIQDAANTLRGYLDRLEADPRRLDAVESRLAAIEKLKRKYGASIAGILAFLAGVSQQLSAAESAGERRQQLAAGQARAAQAYEEAAGALGEVRRKAARKLEKRVETELAQLAMEKTVFCVSLHAGPWSAQGSDEVTLLVSPNPGEEPKPLDKIASGGELSRTALALKTCISEVKKQTMPPTLVFDEVDTGIGGAAAESVGRRLKRLAANQQVLCVTHLAQIAGFADHHFHVEKREAKGRISASIEELSPDRRVKELGRMIAGATVTPEALRHAEQLIRRS